MVSLSLLIVLTIYIVSKAQSMGWGWLSLYYDDDVIIHNSAKKKSSK